MTDKEIIEIDGINVLECEHYQYKSLKDCEMRYPESGDCEIGLINYLFNGNLDMEKLCVDNPNCYFKQLARKTQECEQKDKEINELGQGNEKLVEWQKTVAILFGRTCRCQFLDEKTAICKENGKECISIVGCRDRYRKECEELKEKCEELKEDRYNLNMEMYVLASYRKALEEIKRVLSHCVMTGAIVKILDIINKAKAEEDKQ